MGFLFVVFATGCISIRTYEEKIKACRDLDIKAEAMKDELVLLRNNNRRLKTDARTALQESAKLQQEVQTHAKTVQRIRGTYDQIINDLKENILSGDISVQRRGDNLTIVMEERILFKSGSARLQKRGMNVIDAVANVLKTASDHYIRVEGHTDNVPISGRLAKIYPANWDLAAARASTVIRQLQKNKGIRKENLILAAYAENRPLESNSSEKGRELNRRVEVTLIPFDDL